MEEVNTLVKFLNKVAYRRGYNNHPTKETLDKDCIRLGISEDLKVDIYSYFLYDGNN